MNFAFTYFQYNANAFCTKDQYPYKAVEGTCTPTKCTDGPIDKGFVNITLGDEAAVLKALVDGPVSVEVVSSSWTFYLGGILNSCGTAIDYGVTLIKSNSAEESVTIRNSWGSKWGENELTRLAAKKGMCGYTLAASYPTF